MLRDVNMEERTMKRRRVILCAALLVLLAAMFAAAMAAQRAKPDEERTLASLRKVDDFPLYVMRYYGDYGFKELLQQRTGVRLQRHSAASRPLAEWACTCFAGLSPEGDRIFGRNFDWTTRAALLLFTAPPDGYASVSVVDITYLGFGETAPDADQRRRLLQAPLMPFDGMNEKGLAVGMMAVEGQAPRDPDKVTIDSLEAIRLVLDHARDVDEALALLERYNVDFGDGPTVHYLLADAGGRAAVVEYVQGVVRVIRNEQPWQVATNFLLSEVHPQGAQSPCWRYNTAWQALERNGGLVEPDESMRLLQQVSQGGSYGTRWSVTYDMSRGDVRIAMGRHYEQVHKFRLAVTP
jgi:hypothetical protein